MRWLQGIFRKHTKETKLAMPLSHASANLSPVQIPNVSVPPCIWAFLLHTGSGCLVEYANTILVIKTKASGLLNKHPITELHLSSWPLNSKSLGLKGRRWTDRLWDYRTRKDDSCTGRKEFLRARKKKLPLKARVWAGWKKKKRGEPRDHKE